MKFGKYLASRELELPEYSGHFINYKALKKHIKVLASSHLTVAEEDESEREGALEHDTPIERDLEVSQSPLAASKEGSTTQANAVSPHRCLLGQGDSPLVSFTDSHAPDRLQANKASFFFKVERELEKVNLFYLEKQSDLDIRLDILLAKKVKALKHLRAPSTNTLSVSILHRNLQRLHQDVLRLEQFVELNEIGFTKALKKWDKQSKSHLKELFILTAVNVQPVFHRHEINELSDTVGGCLLELEAVMDGDLPVGKGISRRDSVTRVDHPAHRQATDSPVLVEADTDDTDIDGMYNEYIDLATAVESTAALERWLAAAVARPNAKEKLSRVFLHAVGNAAIPEAFLQSTLVALERVTPQPRAMLDLTLVDELTSETFLHAACKLPHRRRFILPLALAAGVQVERVDANGRTCLHYAAGSVEVLREIMEFGPTGAFRASIDVLDNESMSPLLLAIHADSLAAVRFLLDHGAAAFPLKNHRLQYLPLNYACRFGNAAVVAALIAAAPAALPAAHQADVEGLYPLHVVARYGHAHLVSLLSTPNEINRIDGLNKWPPLFYAVTNIRGATTEQLLQMGAQCDGGVVDGDGHLALYHAAMAGSAEVLNLLAAKGGMKIEEKRSTPRSSRSVTPVDHIPDFQLPPPIIPLRRYGHNFLDKKIFLQLELRPNRESIVLYNAPGAGIAASTFASAATVKENARQTPSVVSPSHPSVFSPSQPSSESSYQPPVVSSYQQPPGRITLLTNISDVVPRNILLPITEHTNTVSFQIEPQDLSQFTIDFELFPTFGTRLLAKATSTANLFAHDGRLHGTDVRVPLFDARLRNAGEMRFDYRLVYPFKGAPLEVAQHDTYWKSTGESAAHHASDSRITASSLAGLFLRIRLLMLNDGTPVVCPDWLIAVGGIEVLIANLTSAELHQVTSNLFDYPKLMADLCDPRSPVTLLQKVLQIIYLPFAAFLQIIPPEVNLDIEVCYPSDVEVECLPFLANSVRSSNAFVDNILTDTFTHIRGLKQLGSKPAQSIVFSLSNPDICTILNWKQPNYPVLFNMGGLRYDGAFTNTTAHGYPLNGSREHVATYSLSAALKFASTNNLLGIIVAGPLLEAVPELVDTIRTQGLILVAAQEDRYVSVKVNGQRFVDVLTFTEEVSV